MAASWGRNLQAPPASTPDSRWIVFIASSSHDHRWTARGEAHANRASMERAKAGCRSERPARWHGPRPEPVRLAGLVRRLVTCSKPSDFASTLPSGVAKCVLRKAPRFLRVPPAGSSASKRRKPRERAAARCKPCRSRSRSDRATGAGAGHGVTGLRVAWAWPRACDGDCQVVSARWRTISPSTM